MIVQHEHNTAQIINQNKQRNYLINPAKNVKFTRQTVLVDNINDMFS